MSTEGTDSRGQTGHLDSDQKCADFTRTSADGSSSLADPNLNIHEAGRFMCAEVDCQCSYVSKGGLKRHMDRMHNKLYRHRCETCERGFMDRSRYYDQRFSMTKIFHSCTTAIPLLGGAMGQWYSDNGIS